MILTTVLAIYLMVSLYLLGTLLSDNEAPLRAYFSVVLWPLLIILIPIAVYAISRGGENCYDEN